jgi:hypothetical protein
MQSDTLHDKSAAAGSARWGHLAKICTAVRKKRAGTLSIILRTASKKIHAAPDITPFQLMALLVGKHYAIMTRMSDHLYGLLLSYSSTSRRSGTV